MGLPILNLVYLRLRQDLSDTSIRLATRKREAETLAHRVSDLHSLAEALRGELAARLAASIAILREETEGLHRRIAQDKITRQELEREAQAIRVVYEPAKGGAA